MNTNSLQQTIGGKEPPYNPPKTKERDRKYKNKRLLRKKKPSSEGGKL